MKLPTVEGLYDEFTTYCSENASGSVISPHRHVSESKGRLQRWIQWSDTKLGNDSMIFLDNRLQNIATLKIYHTNGIWYARVGNGNTLIETTETLSICAAEYDAAEYNDTANPTPYQVKHPTKNTNTDAINMVLQDSATTPTSYHSHQFQHMTQEIHSSTAWSNAPPLLERSDTCSESDSEYPDNSIPESIQDTAISIFITTIPRKEAKC